MSGLRSALSKRRTTKISEAICFTAPLGTTAIAATGKTLDHGPGRNEASICQVGLQFEPEVAPGSVGEDENCQPTRAALKSASRVRSSYDTNRRRHLESDLHRSGRTHPARVSSPGRVSVNTEESTSELVIAPVLIEFKLLHHDCVSQRYPGSTSGNDVARNESRRRRK